MKTNNTVINSIMNNEVNRTFMVKKSFLKYICAVLMIIGTSVHAWGTPYLEYNSTKYYNGDMVTINLAQTTLPAHGSPSMAVKNDAGWTQDGAYRYGIITTTLSGTPVPSNVSFLMGSYTASVGTPVGDDDETSYYTYNPSAQYWNASFQLGYYFAAAGTYDVTMTITETDQADGTTVLQSATITIRFVVTFSGYTITYNLTGLEHANPYNPTATSGEFHAEFELADNYSTPISGTYSDGFVTNAPITIGTSGDCYYNLGDLYYNATPAGNVTINLTATTTCTPLAAPGSLTLSQNHDATHGKTRFGWNSVANASGYKVTISNGSTTASVETASDRYYYITTFPTGNYTWSVSAIGDGSTYCEVNEATDGTPFCVGADLKAVTPSNLAASDVTNTTATISWDEVANAVSYNVWVMNEDEDVIIYDGSTTSTSFTATGLTAGTTYVVWWEAVNSCDGDGYNSAVDNSLSFTATNNHTVSFNANGGSGSMDAVVRTHGTTYDLPECTLVAPSGKVFKCWAEGSAEGTERAVGYTHTVNADITFYAVWRDAVISDYVFSCAELTLTPHLVTDGTPIFITSTASKKVRSQDYIQITGSGLTPNSDLSFPNLNSKFAVLTASGGTLSTDEYGSIDEAAYIFYTPAADATTDGLDQMAGLTVSVGGAKPKQASLVQSIIGRHLPAAGYVIAGKKDNKWYALPSNMASTGTPAPSEIAVDNINNPSIAYTAATNIYGLEGPVASNISGGNGQYVRLTMSIESSEGSGKPAPLFGTSGSEDASNSPKVGKSGTAIATNPLSEGWWWSLTQTNTSITNPQDAKYTIKCANNNHTLSIKNSPFVWGLYASGVEELRLIPASNIPFTEAYFVEWAQHGGVVEVDAEGIDATSVTAHLGANSATATLSQTLTSGKGRASIYNYTVNFEGSIDFAAAASNGALLTLEWKNGETVKAMTSLVVPKIIASTSTLSSHGENDGDWSSAEVHVLPGVTLTANAGDFTSNDVMIRHLEIYPGATVVVTKGSQASGTLKVKTLVLRNGWTRAGEKAYDVARLYITPTTASLAKNAPSEDVWYTDWYIDYDQYYPIAVPWDVTLANITYRYCSVEPTVGHDKNIRLRYYDGSSRAGGGAIGTNWKLYGASGAESVPTKLEPSKGYALTAKRPSGKAFSILRMPLTIPSADWTAGGEKGEVSSVHKNQVSVTGWGKGTADWYAMGWNFIGNPYMCTFNGNDDGIGGKLVDQQGKGVRYATIPDVDFKNYDQVAIADANLKPASGFFIQAENPEATYVTFASSNIVPPSAPTRFKTTTEAIPEQEAYIRLSYEGGKDQMGLIIGEDYTENYEVNADLAKVLGDAGFVKTYMQYGGMDMAYVAINSMLAQQWIPVTVILPTSGEYTFSLTNSSVVGQLEGVYLIDYANDNQVTNLIDEDYVFTSEAGTIGNRFSINAIVGERQTPTDVDIIGADNDSKEPIKFLYHEKVYIYHHGVIYDATGKKVREINK
ncbi:MAG: InlB B-repeat-containing protein [Paludibacteraceae bacterium]|nr:InlB B-repeat-containing protein [Paludibacteraceae bacterium]